jgi:DNA-binding Lrp family transcriptional regulator
MSDTENFKQPYDALDRSLIGLLRNDGRAPLSKLAEILQVSRGTIQNRLDRLLSSGTLLGFTIRVRSDYAADVVRAVMMIEVEGKSTTAVIRQLRGLPELHAIHTTNGSWDLIAEIHASSLQDFDRVLREVRSIDGVLNSETSLLLSSV